MKIEKARGINTEDNENTQRTEKKKTGGQGQRSAVSHPSSRGGRNAEAPRSGSGADETFAPR